MMANKMTRGERVTTEMSMAVETEWTTIVQILVQAVERAAQSNCRAALLLTAPAGEVTLRLSQPAPVGGEPEKASPTPV